MRTRRGIAFRPAAIGAALAALAYGLVVPGMAQAATVTATGSIINTGTSGCLDAFRNGGSGGRLDLWDCNNSPAQRFRQMADGTLQINGACVSVLTITIIGSPDTTAYQAGLLDCTGASYQQWAFNGSGQLVNSAGCLEAADLNTGYVLPVNPCSTGDVNQEWSAPTDLGPPLTGPNTGPNTGPAHILKVCTTAPNAAQIAVQGFGPQNTGFFYLTFNLDQSWPAYDGANWECAWTVNDMWRWWQPEVTILGPDGIEVIPTTITFIDSNGNPIGSSVTAFKGTSGWYDNTFTYYACFVTNLTPPNPQTSC